MNISVLVSKGFLINIDGRGKSERERESERKVVLEESQGRASLPALLNI